MNRVREDERIKAVGPDSWVLPCPTPGPQALDPAFTPMYDGETEIWFDWAFVDFWKANICERLTNLLARTHGNAQHKLNYHFARLDTIQRGTVADPDSAASSTGKCSEWLLLQILEFYIDATPPTSAERRGERACWVPP